MYFSPLLSYVTFIYLTNLRSELIYFENFFYWFLLRGSQFISTGCSVNINFGFASSWSTLCDVIRSCKKILFREAKKRAYKVVYNTVFPFRHIYTLPDTMMIIIHQKSSLIVYFFECMNSDRENHQIDLYFPDCRFLTKKKGLLSRFKLIFEKIVTSRVTFIKGRIDKQQHLFTKDKIIQGNYFL